MKFYIIFFLPLILFSFVEGASPQQVALQETFKNAAKEFKDKYNLDFTYTCGER